MTRTLQRPTFVMAALILGMAAAGSPEAQAQMACGPRDSVIEKLGDQYGETRRGGGLAGPTAIVEIWASEATGTWTIIQTTPNGFSCIVAAGDGWQDECWALKSAGEGA